MQEVRKDVLNSQAISKTGAVTPRYGRKTMALLISEEVREGGEVVLEGIYVGSPKAASLCWSRTHVSTTHR